MSVTPTQAGDPELLRDLIRFPGIPTMPEPPEDGRDYAAWVKFERATADRVRALADEIARTGAHIWRWGDGYGGGVRMIIEEAFNAAQLPREEPLTRRGPDRPKLSARLRREVFERDQYRCVACGSWKNLHCDHVIPVSRGGPTEIGNLQTLCRTCNCSKNDRTPEEWEASREASL